LLAGLQGILDTFYEAAKVDGANRWQRSARNHAPAAANLDVRADHYHHRVVPGVRPGVGDDSARRPLHSAETVVTYIYYQGIELIDISYAASIGVALFLVVFALTLIQLRVFRFRELD